MGGEIEVAVSSSPLDVGKAVERVTDPACGGIGLFLGTARNTAAADGNQERPVIALDYEAHVGLAEEALLSIAREAMKRWDLRRVVAEHRTGRCEVGEPTVVVACSAPHRADALEASRYVIDEIKTRVPIWKEEIYEDGSSWVGPEGEAAEGEERIEDE